MCGFLGCFQASGQRWSEPELAALRSAASRLSHRGNSSHGERVNLAGAALFHHRLAFRDLQDGRQPMTDLLGRATILFNGELYGFRELRARLADRFDFRTRSDTELILAAYLEFGPRLTAHLDGEYAFVIFDHRDGRILAARDPFGVKPLFVSSEKTSSLPSLRSFAPSYALELGPRVYFSSEIKGFPHRIEWDQRGLDRQFLSLHEEMGTSFRNVFALAPGAILELESARDSWKGAIRRVEDRRRAPRLSPEDSFESKADELRAILRRNVESKLDSDVPLGAYLSGGIDSRIAAFEMGRISTTIETFTVGFEGADYDESGAVREFLRAYPNLRGRVLRSNGRALEYSYPHAVYASELVQPYTNGAAKWWLSRFARRYVRGVLTGDGADELFCGYPSYRYLAWWRFYRRHPSKARSRLFADRVVGAREKYWEKGLSSRPDGRDLIESSRLLGWPHPLFAQIEQGGRLWAGDRFEDLLGRERGDLLSYVAPDSGLSPMNIWQNYFMHTHFPAHVLNWVGDRMEMANTLEGRPIFLSRATLEFARLLPDSYLVRGMRDKALLRKAYALELGRFSAAPKKQFNAPFLLDGPLGREFLSPKALCDAGVINPELVAHALKRRKEAEDPLEQSFARIFLQNCLVTQMLDRFLVRRQPPMRDISFEDHYIDEHTEPL